MARIELDDREMGGHLPEVCMRCGSSATVWREKSFELPDKGRTLRGPGPIDRFFALIRLGESFFRDAVRLRAPFCEKHKNHWFWRKVIIFGGVGFWFLLSAGGLWLIGGRGPTVSLVFLFSSFGVWLGAAIVAHETSIKQKGVAKDCLTLNGVADAFVDALEHHRKQSRRRW